MASSNVRDEQILKLDLKTFEHQRAFNLEWTKYVQECSNHERKHRIIEMVVKMIFSDLEEAKKPLTESSFVPGDPFPDNQAIRDKILEVLQQTSLFGDCFFRVPDITHAIFDGNSSWKLLIDWAVKFSIETGFLTGPHEKFLNLMAMELGLMPRDESIVSLYEAAEEIARDIEEKVKKENAAKKPRRPPCFCSNSLMHLS